MTLESYRYGCPPHGHVSLSSRVNGGYFCAACKQRYEQRLDKKTGVLVG